MKALKFYGLFNFFVDDFKENVPVFSWVLLVLGLVMALDFGSESMWISGCHKVWVLNKMG